MVVTVALQCYSSSWNVDGSITGGATARRFMRGTSYVHYSFTLRFPSYYTAHALMQTITDLIGILCQRILYGTAITTTKLETASTLVSASTCQHSTSDTQQQLQHAYSRSMTHDSISEYVD
eukprot:14802-Heterococcus_DN1.PRE.2